MTPKTNSSHERTPLIANGESSHALHDGYGRSNGFFGSIKSALDTSHTAGMDSNNIAVRSLAYTWHVTKVTLLSPVNFLLIAVPFGIIGGLAKWDPVAVFVLNFFAIIPLAAVLSFATEEISLKLGDTMGGLLNATFGNAVELIVSIIALKDNQIQVVQSSMLGSILSNLLLVMGMCFFFGGLIHRGTNGHGTEQEFSSAVAQTTCSLMTLASASLVLPAALYGVLDQSDKHDAAEKQHSILVLSRGTSIILLILYVMYLAFQLRTHSNLFDPRAKSDTEAQLTNGSSQNGHEVAGEEEEEEEEEPSLGPVAAGLVLVVVTLLVAICAEFLVGTIDKVVEKGGLSKGFIGLILIPIVGNAAEHVTAVVVAIRNKMDLAMGVAIGSSIQIAMFMTPFLVIVGWIIGRDMSLHFETFETVAFAVSILVVTYTVQDGKSNYLEGAMLLGLYIIIAVAFYSIPSDVVDPTFNPSG
ncbi:putative calcium ion transporter Vcx1 [Stachybotrys elegans]|uniref:Vacuolar calcium ion transporter n=1 Tax=Stachybotrys elegans TaxID=80388 RepID=A0A8K0SKP9_9HYPO|nr:putative calcium ion transporter Vcx1 [Stachybotrys elegans]